MAGERDRKWRLAESGESKALTVGDALTTILLPGEATGGHFSVSEYDLFPGFPGPPPHVHHEWRHVFHVLEGAISVILDGTERSAIAGSMVWIPAGVVHAFSKPGEQRARVLAIDSPGGFERYYEELSEAFPVPRSTARSSPRFSAASTPTRRVNCPHSVSTVWCALTGVRNLLQ